MSFAVRAFCFSAAAIAGLLLVAAPRDVRAGAIPGLPAPLPLGREGRLHLAIENDFLGRGGRFDDHRTMQLSLDVRVGEHWLVVVDQSFLTDEGPTLNSPDPGEEGRLDEWSITFARRWRGAGGRVMAGAGVRGTGERNGEQVQNGFHRMFDARIVDLPYLKGETDAIGWLALDREWTRPVGDRWQAGAWLSAAGELSTGGRTDGSVGGFGLLRTRAFELRMGLRNEWREGAGDDIVLSSTADSERGLFATFGLGIGPIDVENSQRLDGGEAYGRVLLRAGSGARVAPQPSDRAALEFGLRLPQTAFHVTAAWAPPKMSRMLSGTAQAALTLSYFTGEMPANSSLDVFRLERQLTGGLEWRTTRGGSWVTPLATIGLGWRREALYGMQALAGTESHAVDRVVVTAGTGIDAPMGTLAGRGSLSLRLSIDGWLPFGHATEDFAGRSYSLQGPGAGLTVAIGLAGGP
jgi:hypothetical protein